MLLYIVTILAGIIALLLVLALFVPRKYRIERRIEIDRSVSEVFNYVRFLKNQDYYSKWSMSDPAKRTSFTATDGETGFIYAWDSDNKNTGKGEQEIVRIDENNRIGTEIRFEKPFRNVAQTNMVTASLTDDKTAVSWAMDGKNKYPMNLMNLFMSGMLGKDMETSLKTLKKNLEAF